MKSSIGKSSLVHPILFAIFPIVFLYANNLQLVLTEEIILPLILSVSFSIIFWFILKLILKNSKKAGLIVSLFLVLFFTYGHAYIMINNADIESFLIVQHRYLLIPFGLAFIIGTIYFVKTKRKLNNATAITNGIAITIVLMASLNLINFNFETTSEEIDESLGTVPVSNIENLPDIYYIVLDGYANARTLNLEYNFDNKEFIDFLKAKNFYLPSKTHGNYPLTYLSLTSSLNMKYLNYLEEKLETKQKAQVVANKLMNNNEVMKTLKSKGYKVVSFDTGTWLTNSIQIADWNACGTNYGNSEFLGMLVRTTMFNPIHVQLLETDHREGILCIFSEIPKIKQRTGEPIFVFAHLIIPHPPFLFGSNGEPAEASTLDLTGGWENTEAYVNQLIFANKKTQEVIEQLLADENPPIIIVQSDHGPRGNVDWNNPSDEMLMRVLGIFNAYYFPNDNEKNLYDSITPVNSFRVIFQSYFEDDIELLEDKSYFSNVDNPSSFKDVTHIFTQENWNAMR